MVRSRTASNTVFWVMLAGFVFVAAAANAQPQVSLEGTVTLQPPVAISPLLKSALERPLARSFDRPPVRLGPDTWAAAPPQMEDQNRRTWMIVSGAVVGGMYAATILGDAANAGLDFPEVFIPVVGPFIALARYDSVVGDSYAYSSSDKVLFAASGITQSVFAVIFVMKWRGGGAAREIRQKVERLPMISVVPTARGGVYVGYSKRF